MNEWTYHVITFTATKAVGVMRSRVNSWPDGKSRTTVQIMDGSGAWVATGDMREFTAQAITAHDGTGRLAYLPS